VKRLVLLSIMVLSVVFFNIGKNIFAEEPTEIKKDTASLSGKVVETMDSGRYTYVYLENSNKKQWVAVPKMKVAIGQNVSFRPGIEMVNFESKTLNRTFDKIIFSQGPIAVGE
jgi:hypothetical protein